MPERGGHPSAGKAGQRDEAAEQPIRAFSIFLRLFCWFGFFPSFLSPFFYSLVRERGVLECSGCERERLDERDLACKTARHWGTGIDWSFFLFLLALLYFWAAAFFFPAHVLSSHSSCFLSFLVSSGSSLLHIPPRCIVRFNDFSGSVSVGRLEAMRDDGSVFWGGGVGWHFGITSDAACFVASGLPVSS